MSLHHFRARPVHGDVSPLGIKVRSCGENATYQMREGTLWKDVGSIFSYASGRIVVSHVADATPLEVALLAGHAEEVWRGEVVPSKASAWRFRRGSKCPNYWFTAVLVAADTSADKAAAQIEAIRSPLTLADLRCQSIERVAEIAQAQDAEVAATC